MSKHSLVAEEFKSEVFMKINMSEFVREYLESNGRFFLKYLYSVIGFSEESGRKFDSSEFVQEINGDHFYETILNNYGLEFFVDRWHGGYLLKKVDKEFLQIVSKGHADSDMAQYRKFKSLEEAIKNRVLYDLKKLGIKKIHFEGMIHEGRIYGCEDTVSNCDQNAADKNNQVNPIESNEPKLPTKKQNRGQFILMTK